MMRRLRPGWTKPQPIPRMEQTPQQREALSRDEFHRANQMLRDAGGRTETAFIPPRPAPTPTIDTMVRGLIGQGIAARYERFMEDADDPAHTRLRPVPPPVPKAPEGGKVYPAKLSVHATHCCGFKFIHGFQNGGYGNLHSYSNKEFWDQIRAKFGDNGDWGIWPAFFAFTSATGNHFEEHCSDFAEFIEKNNLGTVWVSEPNYNPNSGNQVTTFIWTVNREGLNKALETGNVEN